MVIIKLHRSTIIPHSIVGDLDDLRQEVRDYYKQKGVEIQHDKSQDKTDIEKSVDYIMET